MVYFPKKLESQLAKRSMAMALRSLPNDNNLIDFSSNDYLGFAHDKDLLQRASDILVENDMILNGSTGSRLLTGNHPLYQKLEKILVRFHEAPEALVFNSGYDANIGFFSAVPQRGDVVFYDEYVHASIRDGIALGKAKSHKFKHNDIADLKLKCQRERPFDAEIYVVTESVFSMDGDSPDVRAMVDLCEKHHCNLIVDEAHAIGVYGNRGVGLVQEADLQERVFARTVTFGKAIGCHGAAILGSGKLKSYLVNFSRSFIYTTALPPHAVAAIISAYERLAERKMDIPGIPLGQGYRERLQENITFFRHEIERLQLQESFISSDSAIQCCLVAGNENVKCVAGILTENGFDVKPIMSPTVPIGHERIRFCLHAFNTKEEIKAVLEILSGNLVKLKDDKEGLQ